MEQNIYPTGSLVQVNSYSPFRGLKGKIQGVDIISDDREELVGFYEIALEGAHLKEPMWFECDEVGLVTSPSNTLEVEA